MKGALPLGAPKEPGVKKMVWFKCQGLGHVVRNCPNRTMVTREEYYNFLVQSRMEESESTHYVEAPHDIGGITSEEFWTNQAKCSPEEAHEVLVLRRSLLAELQDEQRQSIFHSTCLVKDQACSFIIDSGSCTNACSLTMVDKMKLPTRKHPNSYKLNWLNDEGGVWVRKQALVNFKVGEYHDELWCDAIPMTACSLLLGRPWHELTHT